MNTDDAFEDRLDEHFAKYAQSLEAWRFLTSTTGIERLSVELTSILLEQVAVPGHCLRPRLERRVASILSRAYLQGCEHAIDFVRDEGHEALAETMSLRL